MRKVRYWIYWTKTFKVILTLHLKQLEKEEQKTPKISRRKEIIKIQAEINEKEKKETIVKINKTKSWFFEKIKWTNLWPDSPRKKREKNQINKIRSKKERLQQTIKMFL